MGLAKNLDQNPGLIPSPSCRISEKYCQILASALHYIALHQIYFLLVCLANLGYFPVLVFLFLLPLS